MLLKRPTVQRPPRRITRAAERAPGFEAFEGLACPRCRADYDFGDVCPDCEEPLVSAGFADLPPPAASRADRVLASVIFALSACLLLGLALIA